ncbi:MAG: hypothetical protein IPL84_03485 [Chitinophagaceae bacterium]|nr:hypothetical protein [Chitinophagaceae bacterium]
MKKLLLLLAILGLIDVQNAKSQCTISDLKVRLIEVNTSNCELTLDLSGHRKSIMEISMPISISGGNQAIIRQQ